MHLLRLIMSRRVGDTPTPLSTASLRPAAQRSALHRELLDLEAEPGVRLAEDVL